MRRVGIRSPMNLCYPLFGIKGGGKETHITLGLSWAPSPCWTLETRFSGLTRELSCHSIIQWLNPACIIFETFRNRFFPVSFSAAVFNSGVSEDLWEGVCKVGAPGAKGWVRTKQICSSAPRAASGLMCRREKEELGCSKLPCHPCANLQMHMGRDQALRWDIRSQPPRVGISQIQGPLLHLSSSCSRGLEPSVQNQL